MDLSGLLIVAALVIIPLAIFLARTRFRSEPSDDELADAYEGALEEQLDILHEIQDDEQLTLEERARLVQYITEADIDTLVEKLLLDSEDRASVYDTELVDYISGDYHDER